MLEIILWVLMVAISFLVFTQESVARRRVAFYFAFSILAHAAYFNKISDNVDAFYISAGVIDLIVILLISAMREYPRLSGDIQDISLVSIMFSGLGWLMFKADVTEQVFMSMYIALHSWAIIMLIRREPKRNELFGIDNRLFSLHNSALFRRVFHIKEAKKQ